MVSAMERANSSSQEVASRAMVTDPQDEKAAEFYAGFGFRFLTQTRMLMTMAQIRALLGSNAP